LQKAKEKVLMSNIYVVLPTYQKRAIYKNLNTYYQIKIQVQLTFPKHPVQTISFYPVCLKIKERK